MRRKADPEDLMEDYDELSAVDSAYQQGKTDYSNGRPPADEGDAAYMNGYNEDKTSSVKLQQEWKKMQSEKWYDGSLESVTARLDKLDSLKSRVARVLRNATDDSAMRIAAKIIRAMDKELESLAATTTVLADAELDEYLDSMPSLTVARDYGVRTAGDFMDLGEDDGSWLFEQASEVNKNASKYDWDEFTTIHAREWAEDRPSDLRTSEMMFREAAVDYVEAKTEVILDVRKRAQIIDRFVTTAEKTRRELNKSAKRVQSKAPTKTQVDKAVAILKAFYTATGDYGPWTSGSLLIDDGTYGWGGGPDSRAIVWEEGPYEWAQNWELQEDIAQATGLFVEPYTSFSLVLYRNDF